MREILFRGKPKNKANYEFLKKMYKDNCKDGFIYGSLVISHGKNYICIMALCQINSLVDNGTTTMFEVIPETVGEYTGLKDKNGERIFKGDIITVPYVDPIFKSTWGYEFTQKAVVKFKDALFYAEYIDGSEYRITLSALKDYCEVIGNIHDNPELLEG